jgi:hypothetical protein
MKSCLNENCSFPGRAFLDQDWGPELLEIRDEVRMLYHAKTPDAPRNKDWAAKSDWKHSLYGIMGGELDGDKADVRDSRDCLNL